MFLFVVYMINMFCLYLLLKNGSVCCKLYGKLLSCQPNIIEVINLVDM